MDYDPRYDYEPDLCLCDTCGELYDRNDEGVALYTTEGDMYFCKDCTVEK